MPEWKHVASVPKEEGVSAIGADCGWRLVGRSAKDDAVEAALACQAEKVRYGSRCFDFTKKCAACGDIVLALSERDRGHAPDDRCATVESCLPGLRVEQRVSAVSRELDETTRVRLETKVVRVVGRSFFRRVARLLDEERG
jgi:hypothetical protein